jgi:poly(A) polymerase
MNTTIDHLNHNTYLETQPHSPVKLQGAQYETAIKVVMTLQEAGFSTYFAGGWVRDSYAGKSNDDIDIVTNAPCLAIQKLFPVTTDEGLDYGVVFVKESEEIFEVATFRKDGEYKDGRSPTSVEKGSMKDDALRRDFTVNALYYDPISRETFDFTDSLLDIDRRVIRAIGDPFMRFEEDRLRVLRAIRFSTKLEFGFEESTLNAINQYASCLFPSLSKEKVWKELSKMSYYPNFDVGILKMFDTGVLQHIFPTLESVSRVEILKSANKMRALPQHAPTIVKILQLFPNTTKREAIDLCNYLKLSKTNGVQVVNNYYHVRKLLDHAEEATDYDWAIAYGKHQAELFVPHTGSFLDLKERLSTHVGRIQSNNPVVSAQLLKAQGLDPKILKRGFGKLLSEAEKIAVNNSYDNPQDVLHKLKQSTYWPR